MTSDEPVKVNVMRSSQRGSLLHLITIRFLGFGSFICSCQSTFVALFRYEQGAFDRSLAYQLFVAHTPHCTHCPNDLLVGLNSSVSQTKHF